MDEKPEVIEIVPQDCAYGWRASALMSDGSIRYGTSKLHATAEDAIAEVLERLATQDTRP